VKGRAERRSRSSSADGGVEFALESLIELQVQSATSLRRLVGLQGALTGCSPNLDTCVDELSGVLASHGELLADLDVFAVALRLDDSAEDGSASQRSSGIWSAFDEGSLVCVELFRAAPVGDSNELESHEVIFAEGVPPTFHSLVYLTPAKAAVEIHEHVHFGRREVMEAVERFFNAVETHRRSLDRIEALHEMGVIGRTATSAWNVDHFALDSLAQRVIAYSRERADRYVDQIRIGWQLDAVELFGLPLGAPTCLAQSGIPALWLEEAPDSDRGEDFPAFRSSETVRDAATGGDASGRIQIVLPFDFQRRPNWGALVITSSRLLTDDDRVSLTQVAHALGNLLEGVFAARRELDATLRDVNTGLPNEAGLRGALEQLRGDGSPSALVLLGIVDRMKYFETIGLAGLAELFGSAVRELEVEASDLSGRFIGGNLSASIMYGVFEGSFGTRAAKDDLEARLWRALSRLKLSEGGSNFQPEFEVGAVDVDKDAEYTDVIGAAYAALYKSMGSETTKEFVHWGVAESGFTERTRLRREIEISTALVDGQFVSFFQPEYSLRDGSLLSFESLVRWEHPERGLIGPDEFIPIVESSGMVVRSDMQQLRNAVAEAVSWGLADSGPHMRVNLSSSSLHHQGLAAQMLEICEEEGLAPAQLVVEVTETAILRNLETAIAQLEELRDAGVGVALDDFGVGQSSLTRLRALPLTIVKLDRQFVTPLPGTRSDRAFVEALRTMISALDLEITAEGVETEAQRDCLLEIGIERAQGYLLGKPVPATEARLLLKASFEVGTIS